VPLERGCADADGFDVSDMVSLLQLGVVAVMCVAWLSMEEATEGGTGGVVDPPLCVCCGCGCGCGCGWRNVVAVPVWRN